MCAHVPGEKAGGDCRMIVFEDKGKGKGETKRKLRC